TFRDRLKPGTDETVPRRGFCAAWTVPSVPGFKRSLRDILFSFPDRFGRCAVAEYYTVKQGDHAAGIAHRFAFSPYLTIWDHPNNAELKNKRQNPNVLFPGDALYIPDREDREEQCATDKRHTFVLKRKPLKLHLKLRDHYEKPIANARCVLVVDGDSHE